MEWWTPRRIIPKYKKQIFDITLKNESYIIGRHTLFNNDGIVEYDQKPYSCYACRSRKSWVISTYIVILSSILFVSYLIVVVTLLYIKWTYNRIKGYYRITCSTQWSSRFISNSYGEYIYDNLC